MAAVCYTSPCREMLLLGRRRIAARFCELHLEAVPMIQDVDGLLQLHILLFLGWLDCRGFAGLRIAISRGRRIDGILALIAGRLFRIGTGMLLVLEMPRQIALMNLRIFIELRAFAF